MTPTSPPLTVRGSFIAQRLVLRCNLSHNPSYSLIPQLFVKLKVRGSLATALIQAQDKSSFLSSNLQCKTKISLTRFRPKSSGNIHPIHTVPCKFSSFSSSVVIFVLGIFSTYLLSKISLHLSPVLSRSQKKRPTQKTSITNYYGSNRTRHRTRLWSPLCFTRKFLSYSRT